MGLLTTDETQKTLSASFPRQDLTLVQAMVGAAHFNVPKVKELLKQSPELAKACWDWGHGDWETAIGAASHTGNREIVALLIEHGARPDIFTLAMLGQLEVIKQVIKANPGIQKVLGPHGITLLAHAKAGGDESKPVVEYLESLGDADNWSMDLPITDAEEEVYLGEYKFGSGPTDLLKVSKNKQEALMLARESYPGAILRRVEEHGFAPAGAPSVRVRFKVESGRAVAVTIHDSEPIVTATRA